MPTRDEVLSRLVRDRNEKNDALQAAWEAVRELKRQVEERDKLIHRVHAMDESEFVTRAQEVLDRRPPQANQARIVQTPTDPPPQPVPDPTTPDRRPTT